MRPYPHRWTAYSIGRCRHYAQQISPSGEIPVKPIGTRGEPLTAGDVRTAAQNAPQNAVIVTTDATATTISPDDLGHCWLIVWSLRTSTVVKGAHAT